MLMTRREPEKYSTALEAIGKAERWPEWRITLRSVLRTVDVIIMGGLLGLTVPDHTPLSRAEIRREPNRRHACLLVCLV